MKLSNDNKEAIKSSVMVGVAYAMFLGGIMLSTGKEHWYYGALGGFLLGLSTGLLTTCYTEDKQDVADSVTDV